MKVLTYFSLIIIVIPVSIAAADTFVGDQNLYHGFITGNQHDGLSEVNTVEKGLISLNLNNFKITRNRIGRSNTVALLTIPGPIELGMETNAFEKAIKTAASKGPLFILIEIDSPGGRVDLAMRMCSAITETANCDVYAYVKGGNHGGAYSAAAAVSLACNKIYMKPGTVIGSATIITEDSEGKPIDLKKALGDTVSEKFRSGWRNYLASLAERNNRPGILVKAMESKDIEVVEVNENGKRVFIESVNKKPGQTVVKTWSKRDSLLTLPANDAVECGIADKLFESRQELLQDQNATTAQIIPDESMAKARELYQRIEKSLKRIDVSIDLGVKQLKATQSRPQALKAMRGIINDAQFVLGLKKKFGDDVPVDEEKVQTFLNAVQAEYDALRTSGR